MARRGSSSRWGRGSIWGGFTHVSAAERAANVAAELKQATALGVALQPVRASGRLLATTTWGRAWCDHIERYCDAANRLPRGRTYLRSGAVLDLVVAAGELRALVSGSTLYRVRVGVAPMDPAAFAALARDCAGKIDSLVELLQGRLDKATLERLCRPEGGMFPLGKDFAFACSCPDGARMCKHVAATLYGVGCRLDQSPELLFVLRNVQQHELVRAAAVAPMVGGDATLSTGDTALGGDEDLGSLFGFAIDVDDAPVAAASFAAASAAANVDTADVDATEQLALALLRAHEEREFDLTGLLALALETRPTTSSNLRAALSALVLRGLVDESIDPTDRRHWYCISEAGVEE